MRCIPSLAKADGTASIGSWGASRIDGETYRPPDENPVVFLVSSPAPARGQFCALARAVDRAASVGLMPPSLSVRLSSGLKALSRLTNWEAATSRRAQMRPTPDACRDLSELLGHPQRCAPLSPLI